MNILVVGDSGIDVFQYGKCKRMCPEAPVPVFNPTDKTTNVGMAANVYENIKALGGDPMLMSNDVKPVKTRYVDEVSNQMLLRVDVDPVVSKIRWTNPIEADFNQRPATPATVSVIQSNDHFVLASLHIHKTKTRADRL